MSAKLHIRKCAIEFRVKADELDKAVEYYEGLFDVRRKLTFKGLVVLEKEDDLATKSGKWFFVGVRAMAEGSTVEGPVVYWLTEDHTPDVYQEILYGRRPTADDEPPAEDAVGSNSRGSAIDPFGNRLGFTNPDYPPLIGG